MSRPQRRVVRRRVLPLLVAVAAPLLGAPVGHAQQVFLEAREEGQGFLVARSGRCQVVTLEHVAGRSIEDRVTSAVLVGPQRLLGEASLVRSIPSSPEPLLVFDARGPVTAQCPPFVSTSPLDGVLRATTEAQLRMVRRDGAFVNIPLVIQAVDFELFVVRFSSPPARGMSGGTVFVGGQPAGILVDVNPETGLGRVARMDRALERLAPWFQHGAALAPAPEASQGPRTTFRVVRWTSEPLSPGEGATRLEEGGTWRVRAGGRVEIVLALPEATTVSSVSLSVTGLDDPPREVEVLTSPAGVERWVSAGSISIEPGDVSVTHRFSARRTGMVMLRLFSPQPGQQTLALSGVEIR